MTHERRCSRDHGFDEAPLGAVPVELEHLPSGRSESGDALEVDNRLDRAHEHEVVVWFEDFVWGDARDEVLPAVDLREKEPWQTAQARIFHGSVGQWTVGSTSISTVYVRGSIWTGLCVVRCGRRWRPKKMRKATPTTAQGRPTRAGSRNENESVWPDSISKPLTTRLVLVPISVHSPPRIAA